MTHRLRIVLYGVGVWVLPFAFGMLVFPLRELIANDSRRARVKTECEHYDRRKAELDGK